MSVNVQFVFPVCGKRVTRIREPGQKSYFCSQTCFNFARRNGMWGQRKETSLPGDLAHEKVTIKITKDIPIFQQMRPKIGALYAAEKYDGKYHGYVINVNGYRVNIRWNECVEVKE